MSVPPTIQDFSSDFGDLKKRIADSTEASDREWEKGAILASSPSYVSFLERLSGEPSAKVHSVLSDFTADDTFRTEFGGRLREFEADADLVHGDVRFHSLTLYVVARLRRPAVVVETGVASGKSSSLLLLALEHNAFGRMISVDLPNPQGTLLPDGAATHTGRRPVGWLVPDRLRARWDLRLGDSRQILPEVLAELGAVDLFFHDSLHTFDHVMFELTTVAPFLRPPATVLVDNVDVAAGAFEQFLDRHGLLGAQFGDFGGVQVDAPLP